MIQSNLKTILDTLKECEIYEHACHVLNYDMETICPSGGMEEQGNVTAFLSAKAFELKKKEDFQKSLCALHEDMESLDEFHKVLIKRLYEDYIRESKISPEMLLQYKKIYTKAFVDWSEARSSGKYSDFAPSLQRVKEIELEQIDLDPLKVPCVYDNLLDKYEKGLTSSDLDILFNKCKERLIPLLNKIKSSPKKIRKDFMSRPVTDEMQKAMSEYLLDLMKFDRSRGAWTLSEHPFTDGLGKDDTRITTHYYGNNFASSMYSIIHEAGHALFEMNQNPRNFECFTYNYKTLGMHESVSRFYENRIGRSREFVHLIYPACVKIFPEVFKDVSEKELYEALNCVEPSLIRTEADEFTYTFHIIIRYEIEKDILEGKVSIEDVPSLWKKKYKEYLGIEPLNDREGVLQDVHWADGFGYFPTYAIGNFYNAMYYKEMDSSINLKESLLEGDFHKINEWMKNHVWLKADILEPKEWIKDITGRALEADAFLDYLEEKYSALYEL